LFSANRRARAVRAKGFAAPMRKERPAGEKAKKAQLFRAKCDVLKGPPTGKPVEEDPPKELRRGDILAS
jgi:hypothetical protein